MLLSRALQLNLALKELFLWCILDFIIFPCIHLNSYSSPTLNPLGLPKLLTHYAIFALMRL